jgi:translation elongation factor EF-1alpha
MSNFCMLLMLASDEFGVWIADAGKSTIGGQILYLSNMVDERTIQKYEREAKEKNRESWYMAYIMDTNEEERAKVKSMTQFVEILWLVVTRT